MRLPCTASLIRWLPLIYRVHILLGIVFCISLIAPFLRLFPQGRRIWRLDWWFPTVFGAGIVLTGLLLWRVTWFPSTWRGPAFTWHGDLSYVLGGWILLHAFYKTFGLRMRDEGIAARGGSRNGGASHAGSRSARSAPWCSP